MSISSKNLESIRSAVQSFISSENQMEEDGKCDEFMEDDRLDDAIGYCALRLGLKEETVSHYFHKFLREQL